MGRLEGISTCLYAADLKSDSRTHYNAHAWVLADSDIAAAHLDDDPSTDPFALLEGKTSCHTGWLKSAMLFSWVT